MPLLANGYLPLAPIAPAAQAALLIVIIAFESWFIAKTNKIRMTGACFWRVAAVNVITVIIGFGILIPATLLEAWLSFGWGSQYHMNRLLWWSSVWICGVILPIGIWFLCYHVSWRVEFFILRRWAGANFPSPSRSSVILAHRWSYAALGLFVLSGCLFYFYGFIKYR